MFLVALFKGEHGKLHKSKTLHVAGKHGAGPRWRTGGLKTEPHLVLFIVAAGSPSRGRGRGNQTPRDTER